MRRDGCFKVLLLLSAAALLVFFLSDDRSPPVGPSCYERMKHVQARGERYPGEVNRILEECEPDRP